MKLAIIVGHTEKSPGAHAVAPLDEGEYQINRVIAQNIYRLAREAGINAAIFFKDGFTTELVGEHVNNWAKGNELVCAVELHLNSVADSKVYGTETLYDEEPEQSMSLAKFMQKHICQCFDRQGKGDRGIKLIQEGDRGHRNLKAVKIPSVILEPAFCSNPNEAKLMWSLAVPYARSIVNAAMGWFELQKQN